MDDKIKVRLIIAEKDYLLTIKREEEEIVRKAAKLINDKLNRYRAQYAKSNLDLERFLTMVALDFATESLRQEKKNDTVPFTEKIKELTEELDNYFRKEE